MLAGEGQREKKRERTPSRLSTVSTEPDARLELTNREIMTEAETKTNRLRPPGAPITALFNSKQAFCFLEPRKRHHLFNEKVQQPTS